MRHPEKNGIPRLCGVPDWDLRNFRVADNTGATKLRSERVMRELLDCGVGAKRWPNFQALLFGFGVVAVGLVTL